MGLVFVDWCYFQSVGNLRSLTHDKPDGGVDADADIPSGLLLIFSKTFR